PGPLRTVPHVVTQPSMRGTLNQLLCAAVLVGGLSLAGCKQNEGERCEVDSDCSGGLSCTSGAASKHAVCRPGTGSAPLDAAVTPGDGSAADVSAIDQA